MSYWKGINERKDKYEEDTKRKGHMKRKHEKDRKAHRKTWTERPGDQNKTKQKGMDAQGAVGSYKGGKVEKPSKSRTVWTEMGARAGTGVLAARCLGRGNLQATGDAYVAAVELDGGVEAQGVVDALPPRERQQVLHLHAHLARRAHARGHETMACWHTSFASTHGERVDAHAPAAKRAKAGMKSEEEGCKGRQR